MGSYSSGKLDVGATEENAPMSDASKSPPPTKASLAFEEHGREERQMRARVEEYSKSLTFDKLFEFRERERAMQGMSNPAMVRRDVQQVRTRMRLHNRCVLDPNSNVLQTWDLLILVALIYTATFTPYEISFLPANAWSNWFNVFITGMFAIDICKEFLLPYDLPPKAGGGKVKNHRMIAKNYLRGWAPLDIVATIPIDTLVGLANPDGGTAMDALKAIKMLRLARLLRLGRLLRASRVIARLVDTLERYMTISYTMREVGFWTIAMLLAFHLLSCLWGLLAMMRTSQRTEALEAKRVAAVPFCERGPGSCLSECELELLFDMRAATPTGGSADPTTIQYDELWLCRAITSGVLPPESEGQHGWYYFYVLTDMVLSFGIGVYPRAHSEYVLAFVGAMINMVMNTFFLGVIATAMSQSDPLTRDFKARMDHLNHFLKECNAPAELKNRTRGYLRHTRDLVAKKAFDDIYSLFSPKLRDDLHAHASMDTLKVVPFLRDCEDGFLRELAPKLTHHGFEAAEAVRTGSSEGDVLCVVTRGTAVKGGKPITLRQFWGEDFILNSAALRDKRPVSALTYLEITCLRRDHLFELLEAWPQSGSRVRMAALFLALVRAPMLISRYFEMKLPDPQMAALARRGITRKEKGFIHRGNLIDPSAASERSSVGANTWTTASREESDRHRNKVMIASHAKEFDRALKNLGDKSSVSAREHQGIMRMINGGAALRGFARDQRNSEDVDMSRQARDALKVAGDEGRLILDEGGAVVGADGKTIHVEHREQEDAAVAAIRSLRSQLGVEMSNMRRALTSLRGAVGEDATPDWPWPTPATGPPGPSFSGAARPARRKQRIGGGLLEA